MRRILPEPIRQERHSLLGLGAALALLLLILLLTNKIGVDGATGKASNISIGTQVRVANATAFVCNHTIPAGTNLKSFPCLPLSVDLDDFLVNLSSGGSNVEAMYKYTPSSNGKWEVYNSSLPNYTRSTLSTLGRAEGIYLVMSAAETFIYDGFLSSSVSIFLPAGWNLPGYTTNRTRDLNTSLATLDGSWEIIETLEGTEESGTYLIAYPNGTGTLTNTSAYHAYWIYVNTSDTWVIT